MQKLEEAPEQLKAQAEQFVRGVQANAAVTFSEILTNMRLFNQMSEKSKIKIQDLIEKRESLLGQIKVEATPTAKLKRAYRAIDFDGEIIAIFGNVLNMESMHRQKIVEHLVPLAEDLGVATLE